MKTLKYTDAFRDTFDSTFGEYEQEDAAARIVYILSDPVRKTVCYKDMKGESEQLGFLLLVANGCLRSSSVYGGKKNFVITWEFRGRTSRMNIGYTFTELMAERDAEMK